MTASESLLRDYYDYSFSKLLGIRFPAREVGSCPEGSFAECLPNRIGAARAASVARRLVEYESTGSPFAKTSPLVAYLTETSAHGPRRVLDFGCGLGHIATYLSIVLTPVELLHGVDPDPLAAERWARLRHAPSARHCDFLFSPTVGQVNAASSSFDLAIAVHTFHHIASSRQRDALRALVRLLKPDALFYLYEDTWSEKNGPLESSLPVFDARFLALSTRERRTLFAMNDRWSNGWFRERELEAEKGGYRSLEGWTGLLTSEGLTIDRSAAIGFDSRRLHGVPSGWCVARKTGRMSKSQRITGTGRRSLELDSR